MMETSAIIGKKDSLMRFWQRPDSGTGLKCRSPSWAYHGWGKDEMVHRALKEFGFGELLIKRFASNASFKQNDAGDLIYLRGTQAVWKTPEVADLKISLIA